MTRPVWQTVFVGIGSNLDDPLKQVTRALESLGRVEQTERVLISDLYLTKPVGPPGQADYVNAVAGLLTRLSPEKLLDELQAIEHAQGRKRTGERWSARTLDLDILAFADLVIDTDRLRVPHPELVNRDFVLGPWLDIAPQFEVAGSGRVCRLAEAVDLGTLRRIEAGKTSAAEAQRSR